jgi:class 3 adenylate cyclase/predicted ATPase
VGDDLIACGACRHSNPAGSKFCLECGLRLGGRCASCQAVLPAAAKFCNECGAKVVSAAPTPNLAPATYTPAHLVERILTSKASLEGERKQVTVLFADLKGSMELLADRDPEEARKLLDPVLEDMMEAVHRFEGTVNQVMGDGIMALFGAPLAHEDHAVRACYAALRMQESVKRYAEGIFRSYGVPVRIRVGLNSGEVVVRSIGSDLHMDYTAVGQTTHLAARMEQIADPGTIRLTANTLHFAEGFVQVQGLGPTPVKGVAAPVEVYELTGAGLARTRMQIVAARGFTRFVGRDTEMSALDRALDLMRQGHGQVVAIVGEPGIGKSRLFWEFTHSHHTHGALVLECASVSHGKATAYLPLADLLREYFRIERRDDARHAAEKVTGRVLMLDRALEPQLPALMALVDVPVDDPAWVGLEAHQRRRETVEAARRLLLRESQNQPLVLVFEDLHWLDSETQAFLDGLIESLATARVLLLVNYRPEYRHGWSQKTYYAQMRLDPLPQASAAELLETLLGADPSLGPLKSLLITRTEGNPFFLEECVRTLVETGAVQGERGAYRTVRPIGEVQVPGTVQTVLAARIDRLAPDDKRLLQAAAAIGKDVPFPLLEAIVDLSGDALRRGLAQLQTTEFVYETRLFPDLEYMFKHALTHAVAYQSLLKSTRQQLHGRIAQALQERFAGMAAAQPELLAHHLTECGRLEEAATAWERAGERAVSRSAFVEGIAHFRRGLELLETLPASPARVRQQLAIHLKLGGPLTATQGYAAPENLAVHSRARALCEETGETDALFDVLEGLWGYHYVKADLAIARELADQLLAIAERTGDGTGLLRAHTALGCTASSLGEISMAKEHLERALACHDPERHSMLMTAWGADPGIIALGYLSGALTGFGYPDQGFAAAQRAFAIARLRPHSFGMAWGLQTMSFAYLRRGAMTEALETAEALILLSREQGFAQWLAHGMIFRGAALSGLGPPANAISLLKDALAAKLATGAQVSQPAFSCFLASACLRAGEGEAGLAVVAASLEQVERTDDRDSESTLWRLRGQLVLAQQGKDDESEAERSLQKALAVARLQRNRLSELAAATVLAQLWQQQARRDAALELLGPIYAGFTEGFEYPDLRNARALLDELAKP